GRHHAPILQPFFKYAAIRSVVVDNQHSPVIDFHLSPGRELLDWMRLAEKCCRKGERAANARLALDGNLSVHERHQTCGDRQTQASTTVFSRRRGVLLLECAKDSFL